MRGNMADKNKGSSYSNLDPPQGTTYRVSKVHRILAEAGSSRNMWIERWHEDDRTQSLLKLGSTGTQRFALLEKCLIHMYKPIVAQVYHAHTLRVYLLPDQVTSAYIYKRMV